METYETKQIKTLIQNRNYPNITSTNSNIKLKLKLSKCHINIRKSKKVTLNTHTAI